MTIQEKIADLTQYDLIAKLKGTLTAIVSTIPPTPVTTPTGSTIKIQKTTITTAQVLQLFTTPIEVLGAPTAGTVRQVVAIHIVRQPGTAYTLASPFFDIKNSTSNVLSALTMSAPMTNTAIGYAAGLPTNNTNVTGISGSNGITFSAETGNPTVGTGNLDVYITYNEITL